MSSVYCFDPVRLAVLASELSADHRILLDAVRQASTLELDSRVIGFELNRFYNALERGFENIVRNFENHLREELGYHDALIDRVSLTISGIRPAFLPADFVPDVRDLKGFRHAFRHAYDLTLRRDRLTELTHLAAKIEQQHATWVDQFINQFEPA